MERAPASSPSKCRIIVQDGKPIEPKQFNAIVEQIQTTRAKLDGELTPRQRENAASIANCAGCHAPTQTYKLIEWRSKPRADRTSAVVLRLCAKCNAEAQPDTRT